MPVDSPPQPPRAADDEPGAAEHSRAAVLADYRIAYQSRQASLLGRKEVLTGKAKFGIFGDGKEVAQVALAKAFRKGDFRSGYYRDQTLMLALGTAHPGAVLRPALRPPRPRGRPVVGGAADERALRHPQPRPRRLAGAT